MRPKSGRQRISGGGERSGRRAGFGTEELVGSGFVPGAAGRIAKRCSPSRLHPLPRELPPALLPAVEKGHCQANAADSVDAEAKDTFLLE